jgi:hypothetical protein
VNKIAISSRDRRRKHAQHKVTPQKTGLDRLTFYCGSQAPLPIANRNQDAIRFYVTSAGGGESFRCFAGASLMEHDHPAKVKIAALTSEIDAIHRANSLYWAQGEAATFGARTQYHRRLERLEAIRSKLVQLRAAAVQKSTFSSSSSR